MGLKRIIEGSVCNSIIGRRRLIKSTYVIKNRFYQGNFFLRSYCRYIKIRSDGKILLEKLAKNGRCKFALSIAHLRLTSWLKFSFQIFSILVFLKKQSTFLSQMFTVDLWNFQIVPDIEQEKLLTNGEFRDIDNFIDYFFFFVLPISLPLLVTTIFFLLNIKIVIWQIIDLPF